MKYSSIATVLFLILCHCSIMMAAETKEHDAVIVSPDFLHACTEGEIAKVESFLKDHPEWKNGRSEQGETCLHVAGIYGKPDVTRLLLKAGADPNIRSTFAYGLRMTPLSWNVYAGHVENARVLLEEGHADVNMDFDAMGPPSDDGGGGGRRVTCYDVVLEILETFVSEGGDARQEAFMDVKALLEKHGAKTYADLQQGKVEAEL